MIKTVTRQWLKEKGACLNPADLGVIWYRDQRNHSPMALLTASKTNHPDWANWLLARLLTRDQCVQYAIYAAESVLHIYEERYPKDDRPRKAIETAREYLHQKTKSAARSAESAARSAAESAESAAWSAAWSAESAARSAAWSAESAESAARSAAWSAESAAWSAAYQETLTKITDYGISLLGTQP